MTTSRFKSLIHGIKETRALVKWLDELTVHLHGLEIGQGRAVQPGGEELRFAQMPMTQEQTEEWISIVEDQITRLGPTPTHDPGL